MRVSLHTTLQVQVIIMLRSSSIRRSNNNLATLVSQSISDSNTNKKHSIHSYLLPHTTRIERLSSHWVIEPGSFPSHTSDVRYTTTAPMHSRHSSCWPNELAAVTPASARNESLRSNSMYLEMTMLWHFATDTFKFWNSPSKCRCYLWIIPTCYGNTDTFKSQLSRCRYILDSNEDLPTRSSLAFVSGSRYHYTNMAFVCTNIFTTNHFNRRSIRILA